MGSVAPLKGSSPNIHEKLAAGLPPTASLAAMTTARRCANEATLIERTEECLSMLSKARYYDYDDTCPYLRKSATCFANFTVYCKRSELEAAGTLAEYNDVLALMSKWGC